MNTADFSITGVICATFVEEFVVIDTKEIRQGLKEQEELLDDLIRRSIQQAKDINELDEELSNLKEDIKD